MKIGDYENFDESCGIARVENEVGDEDFYVVFAKTSDFDNDISGIGDIIAKHKKYNEALKNAIKFLIKRQKNFEKTFCEQEEESLDNIHTLLGIVKSKLSNFHFCNNEEVIVPIQAWKYVQESEGRSRIVEDEGVFWNASVFLNSERKCEVFSS